MKVQFYKKLPADGLGLLQFFIKHCCTKLKTAFTETVTRHYANITERGLAGGWAKV
jgi:hypothetical protein